MSSRRRTVGTLATVVTLAVAAQAGYVVQPGDTLSAIAARLGTTVRALVEANGIADPDRVQAGRTLELPGGGPAPASGDEARYRVRAGDALSRIARDAGVSVGALQRANGITDADRIQVGQVLRIPGATAPAAPTSAGEPGGPPAGAARRPEAGRVITVVARRYGWNPAFVKALAWQESGWQMGRVSSTGAVGIMQVMPGTGDFVSQELVGRRLELRDPVDNVTAGVVFLDHLWDLTDGDVEQTLAGYYQGLASVRRNGRYPSTDAYIANVLALRSRFS
ncbi:MAG: LysM peptidoglycan-binding domain-containing protein [Actinobacteria bacterium]|nr:LysM peptidoglycan-binding domain-containing protein [Actinomycetota bacterium]